ncbi:hypothetical protein FJTKL_13135 [Diaporthe vaccinii]|uniref:Uncharacterized protein n=1 Tax=Diaporthe vaccinii TaxID=105482 RepID=A0ABR4EBE9_9PEZI
MSTCNARLSSQSPGQILHPARFSLVDFDFSAAAAAEAFKLDSRPIVRLMGAPLARAGPLPLINCLQNPQALAGAWSACRDGRGGAVEVPVVATVIESRTVSDLAALFSSTSGFGGHATTI